MFHGDADAATAAGLIELKKRIAAAKIAPSKLDESVNIATWNIREFGKKPRLKKSLHYIAEILGQFDLVGVVEVRENISDLAEVLRILGPYWRVVYSDFIEDAGGNRERVAYVYDSRALEFTGLTGNANEERKKKDTEYIPERSWWRKPFMASFRAGSFDFIMLTTHIRWGSIEARRAVELELLAEYVQRRANGPNAIDKDIVAMGDFNIPKLDHPLYKAVTKHGLSMPAALAGVHGSNLAKDKRYDQILHNPVFTKSATKFGGAVDFYGGGWGKLYSEAKSDNDPAFTYEMSDHLPLWLQVRTDISDEILDQKLNPRPAGAPKRERDGD